MVEISPWLIAVIIIVAVLLFGPKTIPELAQELVEWMRGRKKSSSAGMGAGDTPAMREEKSTSDATPRA